ncbi:STAS domain-containing protein [Candidatus Margulisiibacteriota bacterium]
MSHENNCTCPECKSHDVNCTCPKCKIHAENCTCPECKPHDSNCTCPKCKPHDKNCHCSECEAHTTNCNCPECESHKHPENCACPECSSVETKIDNDTVTFILKGRFDTVVTTNNSKKLLSSLDEYKEIVFDMTEVSYIASTFLRILIQMAKKSKETSKSFKLKNLQDMIKKVLEMSGMIKLFEIE